MRVACASVAAALALAAFADSDVRQPGISPGPGTRYATDAFPGFDAEGEAFTPEKKEPRWFAFINGPKFGTPGEQLAWAAECEANGSWGRARRAYDALVREWPTSEEAPKAQRAMADVMLNHELDYEGAFAEYRYLLDFYSLQCDSAEVAGVMYKVAELMREEGKTIVFFRFSNTVDVRRAYESLVARAPGAPFVPAAMLTIASLREDEEKYNEAVAVYENLRNLHAGSPEAATALHREGRVRMKLLEDHGYNGTRVSDTVSFLRQSLRGGLPDGVRDDFEAWLAQAERLQEDEAYAAAKFYDARTRTKRSAISAYERFLLDFPASSRADEVRARIEALKEGEGR